VAQLEFGGHSGIFIAREVNEPDEYQRLWQEAVEVYIGFDKYQHRAGDRKIPIMVLVPQAENP